MAGDIFLKEGTIATLESALGGDLTTGTAVAMTTNLDIRSAGTTGAVQNMVAIFQLVCQWTTVPAAGVSPGELYLLPAIDGTNFPDVDTTGGASVLPFTCFKGNFSQTVKVPTTNTAMLFVTDRVRLMPLLYKVYLLNRSAQTIKTTNFTMKVQSARVQYS